MTLSTQIKNCSKVLPGGGGPPGPWWGPPGGPGGPPCGGPGGWCGWGGGGGMVFNRCKNGILSAIDFILFVLQSQISGMTRDKKIRYNHLIYGVIL